MDDSIKISIIAFNITVMFSALFSVFTRSKAWTFGSAVLAIFIAFILGGIAAGATYYVKTKVLK